MNGPKMQIGVAIALTMATLAIRWIHLTGVFEFQSMAWWSIEVLRWIVDLGATVILVVVAFRLWDRLRNVESTIAEIVVILEAERVLLESEDATMDA